MELLRRAGDNKFGYEQCPFCGAKGETSPLSNDPKVKFFAFKDRLSHTEYGISALCQTCQDKTFVEPKE